MAILTTSTDGPRLLVPIAVDALVVNQPVASGVPFNRWQMDYDNLNQLLSPMPAPFQSMEQPPPALGVHLHWALPDALTHGTREGDSDDLTYPFVPNRWLIVRLSPGATATSVRSIQAWVVQSDYLNETGGSNPFINPFNSLAATPGHLDKTRLGTSTPLGAWQGEPGTAQPFFLTAIGLGEVSFAAFAPGVQNVFAFHDDTTSLPSGTLLTYLVMGWYSDPTEDPLYGKAQYGSGGWTTVAQWNDVMAGLQWSVSGTVATPPKQSLFHGMVFSVEWQTAQVPARINGSQDEVAANVKVAVGNTAIEALAAFLQYQTDQTESGSVSSLLEAFQYNQLATLDQPGGETRLDQQVRQASFGSAPGGTRWQIVAAQRTAQTLSQAPLSITLDQATALAQLNGQQQQLDEARRDLGSLQWELYALWWKQQLLNTGYQPQFPPDNFSAIVQQVAAALNTTQTNPPSFINAVANQQTQVANQANALPDPDDPDSIGKFAQNFLPDTLVLKPSKMPRFWHPNDPVVLAYGLGRSQRHGEDGRYNADGTMTCRLPGQTINSLTVGSTTVTAALMQADIPVLTNKFLPAQVEDLCIEAFLLDPADAALIAQDGLHATDTATINNVTAAQSALVAGLPTPFAATAWAQAWSPLFLEWMVTWYPTATQDDQDNWHFDSAHWPFDGSDYGWSGGDVSSDNAKSYSGRTFLTPQVNFNFSDRLQKYLQVEPEADLQQIENLLDQVYQWDFLSQTLSGLTDQLIMRDLEQNLAPDSTVATQVGAQYDGVPDVAAGDVDNSFGGAPPFFFPLRGGFLQFEKLELIDCFGQVVDLLWANGNPGGQYASFEPIRGRGLVPSANNGLSQPRHLVQLPPRVAEPARLDFRLVSSEGDDDVDLVAGTTPVCGWLLPNHLDRGLAVYDVSGQMLGELLLRPAVTQGPTLDWQPAPTAPLPITSPVQIPNAHLRGIITAIVNRSDGAAVLENLLQVIDETLWTVNPLGSQGDQNLAVLIGRPLAVVRAKLALTLDGHPVHDQSWGETLQNDSADLTTTTFQMRLGDITLPDDGLMGYYLKSQGGDDYQVLNAVHSPEDLQPNNPAYIAPIGQNGNYLALQFASSSVQFITMLLDPRGSVHASTGILPVKSFTLPPQFYQDALAQMLLTFRAGPLLLNPEALALPLPSEQNATWSWVRRTGAGPGDWQETPVAKSNQKARLSDAALTVEDGWLKLSSVEGNDSDG